MPQPNLLKSKFNAALMLTLLSTSSNVIAGIDDPSDRKVVGEIVKFSTGQGLNQIDGKDVKFVSKSNLFIEDNAGINKHTIYIDVDNIVVNKITSNVAADKEALLITTKDVKNIEIGDISATNPQSKFRHHISDPADGSSKGPLTLRLIGNSYSGLITDPSGRDMTLISDSANGELVEYNGKLGGEDKKIKKLVVLSDFKHYVDEVFMVKEIGTAEKPSTFILSCPWEAKRLYPYQTNSFKINNNTWNNAESTYRVQANNQDEETVAYLTDQEPNPTKADWGRLEINSDGGNITVAVHPPYFSKEQGFGGKIRFGELKISGKKRSKLIDFWYIKAKNIKVVDGAFDWSEQTEVRDTASWFAENIIFKDATLLSAGELRATQLLEITNSTFNRLPQQRLNELKVSSNNTGKVIFNGLITIYAPWGGMDLYNAKDVINSPGTKFKYIVFKKDRAVDPDSEKKSDLIVQYFSYGSGPNVSKFDVKKEDVEVVIEDQDSEIAWDVSDFEVKLAKSFASDGSALDENGVKTGFSGGVVIYKKGAGSLKPQIRLIRSLPTPPPPPKVFEPGKYVLDEKYAEQIQGKQVEWELVKDSRLEAGVDAVDSTWHLGKHTLSHAGVGKLTGKWDITADYDIAHLKEGSTAVALPHGTFKILPGSTLDASGVDTMAVEVKLTSDDFVQAGGKLLALKFPLVEVEGDGKLTIKPDTKVNVNITGTDKFIKWQATDPTVLSSTGLVVQGTQLKPEPTTFPTGQTSSLDKDYVEHVKVDGATVQLEKDVRLEDGASGTTSTWNLGSHLKSFGGWEVKRQVGYQ